MLPVCGVKKEESRQSAGSISISFVCLFLSTCEDVGCAFSSFSLFHLLTLLHTVRKLPVAVKRQNKTPCRAREREREVHKNSYQIQYLQKEANAETAMALLNNKVLRVLFKMTNDSRQHHAHDFRVWNIQQRPLREEIRKN